MEPELSRQPDVIVGNKVPDEEKSLSPLQLAVRRFFKNKLAIVGVIIMILMVIVAIFADVIATHDPTRADLLNIEQRSSAEHILGTDGSGRDNFSRLVYGARISLMIGFFSMLSTVIVGGTLGAIAGYYGKWVDGLIMRLTDLILIFPFLLMVLTVVSILERMNITIFILVMALTNWPNIARVLRGTFLSIREKDFIMSARSIGCSDFRIIRKHFIPNAVGPIIVNATIMMAIMIIIESGLSFIGAGIPQPTPTWGNMLSEAQSIRVLRNNPETWLPPGLSILLVVLAINFIGDGLRDAFDSKS
ncbi:oligopeptide ABC transporter permease [Alkalicoccobacillus plakortidis]|uniref:ABC transporter permease n=1 Tax=Alkalicoccobacillus plakortidis TaxID=444060 RepID=A0ABT0XIG8_9BACI|nr:oligopeptide ABC transporter permease [Alkalicoccobacillus plakortidis]MCM2675707.1 ABC transporter permease [Alkalicoccobacillus plakortidis]